MLRDSHGGMGYWSFTPQYYESFLTRVYRVEPSNAHICNTLDFLNMEESESHEEIINRGGLIFLSHPVT